MGHGFSYLAPSEHFRFYKGLGVDREVGFRQVISRFRG